MAQLIEFLLRLSFGLSAAMATVSHRQVTSGYFRNHLYVTLGLSALAALLARTAAPTVFWYAVSAVAASYLGSVAWLYEKPHLGRLLLLAVAACSLFGSLANFGGQVASKSEASLNANPPAIEKDARAESPIEKYPEKRAESMETASRVLGLLSHLTSGLLLGLTMAAMLLGHWYLNAPGMELEPLRRLLILLGVVVLLHAVVCGTGLWLEATSRHLATTWWLFVALRWLFGLVGVAALTVMAWKTLEIPNTQSATGILYVAVIGAFVGETMSLLLSAEAFYPV